MPPFTYKARNAQGAVLEGIIEAQEQRVVIDQLHSQKLVILEVKEKTISPLDIIKGLVKSKGQVTSKDLVLFSRQLSTLVSAGVPIVQGLAILESQMEEPRFKEIVEIGRAAGRG